MKVKCKSPTFSLTIATDEIDHHACVKTVAKNSSAALMFSTPEATNDKIRNACIVVINGQPVFTRDDTRCALCQLFDSKADTVAIDFAPERQLTASEQRKAVHEHGLFQPDLLDDTHTPSLTVDHIRAIASIHHLDIDFSPEASSPEEVNLAIGALQSHAMTPDEQSLGTFTRRKLKKLSTWNDWLAGERQQLDQFHTLQMFGDAVPCPPDAIVLCPH